MELVLVAIVALVILAGVDADLWPRPMPRARRARQTARSVRRAPVRPPSARRVHATRQLCTAPRWWWE